MRINTSKIKFEDLNECASVCGICDANIKLLEKLMIVSIYPKGNELMLEGAKEAVSKTKSVISALMTLNKKSVLINERKIKDIVDKIENKNIDMVASVIRIPKNGKPVQMRTINQGEYLQKMENHDIVFATGPAGTGKTFLAVAYALSEIAKEKYERLIVTRPVVEAGESLGYLPGDFEQKISPYMRPVYDSLYCLLPQEVIKKYAEEDRIEVAPLAYMRGRTLSNSFIILDEAQNTSISQMKMFLSRIGENSKTVITGDTTQIDLPKSVQSGLIHALKILSGIEEIAFQTFDKKDIVRHHLVGKILASYDKSAKGFE